MGKMKTKRILDMEALNKIIKKQDGQCLDKSTHYKKEKKRKSVGIACGVQLV
jgi:hypothetical protein